MSKYTTGEMAKLCNVSVRTVQFYDTKGILHPTELTEGGRRLYNDSDLSQLRLICALKAVGLSLDLIKDILESESPGKVLSLLLNEQARRIEGEVAILQGQLKTIEAVKEHVRDKDVIPVNSIIDIENMMENNKKVRRKYVKFTTIACLLTLPQIALILLWVREGIWLPFAIAYPIQCLLGILLAKHHFKDAAFICAECNAVFKPPFKKVMRTSGTPKARWLTCTECGHDGYCVETYVERKDS